MLLYSKTFDQNINIKVFLRLAAVIHLDQLLKKFSLVSVFFWFTLYSQFSSNLTFYLITLQYHAIVICRQRKLARGLLCYRNFVCVNLSRENKRFIQTLICWCLMIFTTLFLLNNQAYMFFLPSHSSYSLIILSSYFSKMFVCGFSGSTHHSHGRTLEKKNR